jgi:hypothetical protein
MVMICGELAIAPKPVLLAGGVGMDENPPLADAGGEGGGVSKVALWVFVGDSYSMVNL